MYPLLHKEGLVLPYMILQCIFVALGVSLSSAVSSSITVAAPHASVAGVATDKPAWWRYAFGVY